MSDVEEVGNIVSVDTAEVEEGRSSDKSAPRDRSIAVFIDGTIAVLRTSALVQPLTLDIFPISLLDLASINNLR